MGQLALSRHRWQEALDWSRRSRLAAPARFAPIGIAGDALLELGGYDRAFAAIDRRLELRPDLASYSRASYAAELRGEREAAIALMGFAVDAGRPGSEPRAWARVQLGLLRFGGGDLAAAGDQMRAALAERPGDPRASAGLARVLAAQGRLDEAARRYSAAIDRLPLPEYPAALAEIELARGRPVAARENLELVRAMQALLADSGVRTDLDLALIEADFGRPSAAGVAATRRRARRPPGRGGRRRARLGADPVRRLPRGTRHGPAQPPPRYAGCPDALPCRDGGGVRRGARRGGRPASRRARAQPPVLGSLGARGAADARERGRRVIRRILLLALAALLLGTAAAQAHPLGNFTVNHYTRAELSGAEIYVRYVADLAEVPTVRERSRIESSGGLVPYAAAAATELAGDLVVSVDGRRAPLEPVSQVATLHPGAAGLETLRLAAWYRTAMPAGIADGTHRVTVRDGTFSGRIGWREVVVRASSGARVGAGAPVADVSDELRGYPDGLLSRPLDVTEAEFTWSPGEGSGAVGPLTRDPESRPAAADHEGSGFASLVEGDLSAGVIAVALLLALGWGALHALSPGHGKSMVAAYLVGTRGTARHAFLLGAFVTVTHITSVVLFGLAALWLSEFIVPDTLFRWLSLVAGLLVLAIGAWVLRGRVRRFREGRRRTPDTGRAASVRPRELALAGHHPHGHVHPGHTHDHEHRSPRPISRPRARAPPSAPRRRRRRPQPHTPRGPLRASPRRRRPDGRAAALPVGDGAVARRHLTAPDRLRAAPRGRLLARPRGAADADRAPGALRARVHGAAAPRRARGAERPGRVRPRDRRPGRRVDRARDPRVDIGAARWSSAGRPPRVASHCGKVACGHPTGLRPWRRLGPGHDVGWHRSAAAGRAERSLARPAGPGERLPARRPPSRCPVGNDRARDERRSPRRDGRRAVDRRASGDAVPRRAPRSGRSGAGVSAAGAASALAQRAERSWTSDRRPAQQPMGSRTNGGGPL